MYSIIYKQQAKNVKIYEFLHVHDYMKNAEITTFLQQNTSKIALKCLCIV